MEPPTRLPEPTPPVLYGKGVDPTLNACAGSTRSPAAPLPSVCPRCLSALHRRPGATSECSVCGLLVADLDLALELEPPASPVHPAVAALFLGLGLALTGLAALYLCLLAGR